MKNRVFAVVAAAVLTGCAAPPPAEPVPVTLRVFDKALAEAALRPGTGSIHGTALLRQRSGSVVTCAGTRVLLIPYTDHAADRMAVFYGWPESNFLRVGPPRKISLINDSPDYGKTTRTTLCDAQGRFRFDNVAEGSFFLRTRVIWSLSSGSLDGGDLIRRVDINAGQTVEVMLTPN
jgi:hypothetical protein